MVGEAAWPAGRLTDFLALANGVLWGPGAFPQLGRLSFFKPCMRLQLITRPRTASDLSAL